MDNNNTTVEAIRSSFIERLALCGEEDGMPRIAGRLIGFLMVHEGACSLDDLAEALQASKGSVSTNARMLEERGILIRTSSPGDRRDFYEIAPGPWEQFIANARRKVKRFQEVVDDTLKVLPSSQVVARRRLKEASLFYRFLLDRLAEHQLLWAAVLAEAERNGEFDEAVVLPASKSRGTK